MSEDGVVVRSGGGKGGGKGDRTSEAEKGAERKDIRSGGGCRLHSVA